MKMAQEDFARSRYYLLRTQQVWRSPLKEGTKLHENSLTIYFSVTQSTNRAD